MARHSPTRYPPPRWLRQGRHRRRRGLRFAEWLAVAVVGGFGGTMAALHLAPGGSSAFADIAVRSAEPDALSAHFGFCHSGGGRNCVVDGDTFWFAGEKYRIADIDTPETHPPRCAEEARLGRAATDRLRAWLNAGAFSLEEIDRDSDRYGRKLRIVVRGGTSVGSVLVAEGLARPWEGHRRPWC